VPHSIHQTNPQPELTTKTLNVIMPKLSIRKLLLEQYFLSYMDIDIELDEYIENRGDDGSNDGSDDGSNDTSCSSATDSSSGSFTISLDFLLNLASNRYLYSRQIVPKTTGL